MRIRTTAACCMAAMTVLAAGACKEVVDPPLHAEAVSFVPAPVYGHWWSMVESCVGMTRSMSTVSWYVIPGVSAFPIRNGDRTDYVSGYWSAAGNRIVLAGTAQLNGAAVRHEMLHSITQAPGHPRETFLRRCAGVVECGPWCIADSEPPPVPEATTPRVGPQALELGVTVSPPVPTASVNDGFFTLTVSARNPASNPVVVTLSTPSLVILGRTFSYEMRRGTDRFVGGLAYFDFEGTMFAPGETKRQVFDLRVGNGVDPFTLAAGDYIVRGFYDEVWTEFQPLTLGP